MVGHGIVATGPLLSGTLLHPGGGGPYAASRYFGFDVEPWADRPCHRCSFVALDQRRMCKFRRQPGVLHSGRCTQDLAEEKGGPPVDADGHRILARLTKGNADWHPIALKVRDTISYFAELMCICA